jgi:hypothetical protein
MRVWLALSFLFELDPSIYNGNTMLKRLLYSSDMRLLGFLYLSNVLMH